MLDILDKVFIPQVYLPIIYTCIAILVNGISKRIINRIIKNKQQSFTKNSYNYKKTETFKVILNNIIKYIIIGFLIIAILTVYKVDVSSVLAGLGIAGLVLGLALQDLAKDIIAGISILLENQYAMGDTISIGNFKGEVIFLGLKTTRIKSWDGQVKIFANRNINEVVNYSMENSMAIVDISVSYEDDVEKVEKILNNLAEELTETLPKLKGKVEVLGIDQLSDSGITFRMIVPTVAMEHYAVQREMRKKIKLCLDQKKVKIPYPQVEVHHGE